MVSKVHFYSLMAEQAAKQITGSFQQWTSFLSTASRLYKYPYPDQLMIHIQRPDATACAEYELWSDTMGRYVKRGAKGIALLDCRGEQPRLRYVFDVSDTGARENSRPVILWEMREEYRRPVQDALERAFGASGEKSLESQLEEAASRLAEDYWQNYGRQFLHILADSYLEEYDEDNLSVVFQRAVAASAAYQACARCTEEADEYFVQTDFLDVLDFNTRQTANALGTAVNGVSRQIFREIETAIRSYERSKALERSQNDERNQLYHERELSDSRHPAGGDGKEGAGQVRQNAADISGGTKPHAVQRLGADGEAVPPSLGDSGHGGAAAEADHGGAASEGSGAGQENQTVGMGAAYEQSEGSGGRGDHGGAYQQLSFLFPTEEERNIGTGEKAESGKLPAFSVVDEKNEEIQGSRTEGEIQERHQKEQTAEEKTQPAEQKVQPAAAGNFRITDEHLGEGGPKQKFARNIEAIRTLFKIEEEGRDATLEEQTVLSQYVGWGGLADAFDPDKAAWSREYEELKGLLSGEEYAAARASVLNAHYTSPTVIRGIYDAVAGLGFRTGNILEPSMGIGNFFGMLPEEMRGSRLYGVELDSITGRIAGKLYPEAEIAVQGFEKTDRRDFYDLAVGNVPFGDYRVNDRAYNKLGFSVHNYFFAKALDQVRPGGIVAFVTSRYTMDAKSPEVRRYLAGKARLLGAVRLPNNAFRANAGTEVVSDILFLQKREHPVEAEEEWVHLGQTEDGIVLNSYFLSHPEMVLGRLALESSQYGKEECTVLPIPGAELSEQLKRAAALVRGNYRESLETEPEAAESMGKCIPADPGVKNFSYCVVDGGVYFRENSLMRLAERYGTGAERVRGMVGLRQIVNELIEYQMEDYPEEAIRQKQGQLDEAYESFTGKYGLINSRANETAFSEDSSYYLLCSLENLDQEGRLESKADMFTKRTIRPERRVTRVDTPSEALGVSVGERGRVDLPFMARLLGTPGEYGAIVGELEGVIFKDPLGPESQEEGWGTGDEYLSGNVRDKLRTARLAAQRDSRFEVNVAALEKAQPKDLEASEIDVRLGATWIDQKYIRQFMHETFDTPFYLKRYTDVKYSEVTAEWAVEGKNAFGANDVAAYVTFGTRRANAYKILEDSLNLRDVRIYDTVQGEDGREKRVLNKRETTLAQQKQQAVREAFRDWVWKDPQRRETLVKKYNELFNAVRPREYDGSHIRFGGMNSDIRLRPHQRNAIAHVLYGGNTLLAHEVGAGKTFEMAAAAMESKRLGLCRKSLFVVPNHLTLQWASEFLRLYPSAKILVATKKDFETSRRKKFCARIATGDYDAVIMGHSQFEKIPISPERQERMLQLQIDEITDALGELKRRQGEGFSIRQMEKTRKGLQARLDKLTSTERKDDVVCFEQLGVDRLFVDESQAYKNLFLYTKMCNVAGLSTSEAQRGSDMFMKCRYLDEVTGGRGVVFASGTPVSNSMTEMYTVMRYLQYDTLQQKGLSHFDCWASTFGETTTSIELAPEGNGYRARTRFAKFFNLPELMNLFKEAADIKTADQLDLPVPEAVFETVVVQPSRIQKEMVAALSERAARVHAGQVNASEDNMLCITADGRKIGLDQRLMNPLLPDDPGSKLNACVSGVLRIWEEGRGQRLTQMIFCDLSTPKGDGSFNVYDDIRGKLLSGDVPAEEVAFIHHADTETKKKELFAKVRCGKVRVLLGSTQKMGAGTNVQDLLAAVHHLDMGWRPADMTQRNGRIIRQGNRNSQVRIYQYVTEGTFDAYLYQTLENKQKFISQIMTSKSPVRSCEDVDEQVLSYAEIKALCAGNPLIRQKMDLDIDVARLKVLKADHMSQQYRLEDKILKYFPAELERQSGYVRGLGEDGRRADAHPVPEEGFAGMEIQGRLYGDRQLAGEALLAARGLCRGTEQVDIGSYRGFRMELSYSVFQNEYEMTLKGAMSHSVRLGGDARGNLLRMDHVLAGIPEREKEAGEQLEILKGQREAAMAELGKPFPQEAELAEKSRRLAELDAELNMDMVADVELGADAELDKGAELNKDVDVDMDVEVGADMDQDAGMGVDGKCAERAGRGAAEGESEKAAGRSVGEPVGEPARKMAGEMVGGISEKIAEREVGKAVICPQADNPAKVDSRERNLEVRKSVLEDLKSRCAVPGAAPKRRASHEEVL